MDMVSIMLYPIRPRMCSQCILAMLEPWEFLPKGDKFIKAYLREEQIGNVFEVITMRAGLRGRETAEYALT